MLTIVRAVVSLLTLLVASSSAHAQGAAQFEEFSNTLLGKVAIAAISAVLSLLVGYILLYIKERREPAKRLSYNVEFRKGMLGIEERLAKDISVRYKGKPAENISYVRCDLLNSGSSVVRLQRVRFEFPEGTEIIDYQIDPKPPKEVGLVLFDVMKDEKHEKTFVFQQLERNRHVTLHFVIEGDTSKGLRLFGFNEEDDVQVVPGGVGAAADDRKILERFAFIYALTLFVPHILHPIPIFGELAAGIFYLIAAISVLPFLPVVARTVAVLVTGIGNKREPTVAVEYLKAGGSVIIGARVSGIEQHTTPLSAEKLSKQFEAM